MVIPPPFQPAGPIVTSLRDGRAPNRDAVIETLADPPANADPAGLEALATRGRGLLSHGTGRLAIHTLGRRLGITDESTAPHLIRTLLGVDEA